MNLTIAPGQLNIDLKLAKEDSLGHHILLDLYNCDEQSFLSNNKFKKVFREAVKMAGCTIVAEKFHNFSPCGLSGCLILSESSAQYHSWSENRYAAIDLFTVANM